MDGWMDGWIQPRVGPPNVSGVSFLLEMDTEVLMGHCQGISSCSFSLACTLWEPIGICIRLMWWEEYFEVYYLSSYVTMGNHNLCRLLVSSLKI
jgi:hypothetical protein